MNGTLEQLFAFTKLMNDFRLVQRQLIVNGEDRHENDVEHSYQLAMLCWYIIETENLTLDLNLVLKYALLHDLVEVHAGDVPFFSQTAAVSQAKREREHAALEHLTESHAEFSPLAKYIAEYQEHANPESKFVYAADKLQPMLNIYMDQGRSWKNEHVTYEMEVLLKPAKIAVDPTIEKIFNEFMQLLAEHKEVFYSEEK